MKKQICILTKSLKDHDYCVAGIDMETGNWIRLVSSSTGEAFPKNLLDDNNYEELDVIETEILKAVPLYTQQENCLINESCSITKIGNKKLWNILELHHLDNPKYIFGTPTNELNKAETNNIKHSLEMLRVNRLELDTCLKGDGRNHYKVSFFYNGNKYKLALTDPKFRKEEYHSMRIPSAVIVVSIPAYPYGEDELFYKFVAKIFA